MRAPASGVDHRRRAALTLALALTVLHAPLGTGAALGAAPASPLCVPPTLSASAARAGGAVTVTPAPNTVDASYRTQISFVGVPASQITAVAVVGAASGAHRGRLEAYSQGDGASFVPSVPFAQGERVTVHATLRQGATLKPFSWRFTTAVVDTVSRSLETPPAPPPPAKPGEYQHFHSRPDLVPPTVTVTANSGAQAPGDLLLAPYAGPGQYGPMILDSSGSLLWFDRLPKGARAADLRAQEYGGAPVLTWWQDPVIAGGHRGSGLVIADSSYRTVAVVRAGNGYEPDLHAFRITPQGTAVFTVYDAIRCNLSAYGGPAEGAVADTLTQEIDLRTGLVRYEWHSLDHVALRDSYIAASAVNGPRTPWDFFHINAVEAQPSGNLLIDSRNTWAAYEVDGHSGQIAWRLGGKHSSFAMGPGAAPAWQHDARELPDGTITFFDNGGTPKVHPQSRGLVLHLDPQQGTATLVASFVNSTPLLAASQGDLQPLAGGNWLVGFGQEPYFSEFSPTGQLLFAGHLPAAYQSYTMLKYPWSGTPAAPPQLALAAGANGGVVAYASWNGATAVAQWRLLGGASPGSLAPLAAAPRAGFETPLAAASTPRYAAVQALDAQGRVLGTSAVTRG
ncbi:MAG TPA: arylsulfotransferase family protein [Solirubrobacteraceae bacterium]